MSKFFCVLNADGSTSCVNAEQIVSVHDRGGKCRLHLLDGREINLNCGMRTLMRAAGLDPHWLNLRPNSEYGEVYSSFPGSETKGSPPASTGPVEAPAAGSYEGDAQGVVPARHTSAEEIRARVSVAPAPFSAEEARRMANIKVAHELMSARERKSRVLAPLVDSINRSWAGRGTPAAPSEPVSPDKSAPPESPVGRLLPNSHAQQSGCSVDPFDSRSAPDAERSNADVEQLPNRLPDSARVLDKSPEKPQDSDPDVVRRPLEAYFAIMDQVSHSLVMEKKADPVQVRLLIDRATDAFRAADLHRRHLERELKDQQAKQSALRKAVSDCESVIQQLEHDLSGYRKATAVPGPNYSGLLNSSPGEPFPAAVVAEPPGPCTVAPPELLTSAGEILDFRKDICLAVLSKSHATIPEGLAEYSRKLAEAVMFTKPIS